MNSSAKVRIQLDVSPSVADTIQELLRRTGQSTRKDVILSGLSLLKWAVSQRDRGRKIASFGADSTVSELAMPALDLIGSSAFDLTPREEEILSLAARGAAYKVIAAQQGRSLSSIAKDLPQIYRKLGAKNKAQALAQFANLNR